MEVIEIATGKILSTYEEKNLVVNSGLLNVCKLLGGDAAGSKISKIAVGTGNTAPVGTDTTITNQFLKAVDSVAYIGTDTVQFNYGIEGSEANGLTVTEAGLFTNSNVLFARKIVNPITKTSAIALRGVWEIKCS